MKKLSVGVVLCLIFSQSSALAQVGTAFTYQGKLVDAGAPASGVYDFEFQLFTLASGGAGSSVQTLGDVPVANGLFTVKLDFGAAFIGGPRFLEIRVRPGVSAGVYTALATRQEMTPTPNAIFSTSAAIAATATSAGAVTGTVGVPNGGTARPRSRPTGSCSGREPRQSQPRLARQARSSRALQALRCGRSRHRSAAI